MSNQATLFNIINQDKDGDYSLAIRGGKVVLALSNPTDTYQQWMRKESHLRDDHSQLTFVLVNKATNQAIKEGQSGPVSLVPYDGNPDKDNSLLWSESKNDDQGFRYIRMATSLGYHFTANSHIVEDGRVVDLSMGENICDRWKFVPVQKRTTTVQTVTISCRVKDGYNLTVLDNTLVLAPANAKDRNQIWIKDLSYCKQVKDQDNKRAFALVHKATGKAISHGFGAGYLTQLAPFNLDYLDGSILWTENEKDNGYREIRTQINTSAVFHAFYVHETDSNKALLALRSRNDSNNQRWKFQETTWSDAGDNTTTTPAKPTNAGADGSKDSTKPNAGNDTTTTPAKPTNAGADGGKDNTKPGTWNTGKSDLVIDEA